MVPAGKGVALLLGAKTLREACKTQTSVGKGRVGDHVDPCPCPRGKGEWIDRTGNFE